MAHHESSSAPHHTGESIDPTAGNQVALIDRLPAQASRLEGHPTDGPGNAVALRHSSPAIRETGLDVRDGFVDGEVVDDGVEALPGGIGQELLDEPGQRPPIRVDAEVGRKNGRVEGSSVAAITAAPEEEPTEPLAITAGSDSGESGQGGGSDNVDRMRDPAYRAEKGTVYGVPRERVDGIVSDATKQDVAKRESRRGRGALTFLRNRRKNADKAVDQYLDEQQTANDEIREYYREQGLSEEAAEASIKAYELTNALEVTRMTTESRESALGKNGLVKGFLNWWQSKHTEYRPWAGREFWNAQNLKHMAEKGLVLLPVAVAAGLGGAAIGGAAAATFAVVSRTLARSFASAKINAAANAGTVAQARGQQVRSSLFSDFEHGVDGGRYLDAAGQEIDASRSYIGNLTASTEQYVGENRKRLALAGGFGLAAAVIGSSLAEAFQNMIGSGGQAQASAMGAKEAPAPAEAAVVPKVEIQDLQIDDELAGDNRYIWGAYEDMYGTSNATSTIMERVDVLRANGWQVETWGDTKGDLWGISTVTAPADQYLVFPDGHVEHLDGQAFMGTEDKVGALEKALAYQDAKVVSGDELAKLGVQTGDAEVQAASAPEQVAAPETAPEAVAAAAVQESAGPVGPEQLLDDRPIVGWPYQVGAGVIAGAAGVVAANQIRAAIKNTKVIREEEGPTKSDNKSAKTQPETRVVDVEALDYLTDYLQRHPGGDRIFFDQLVSEMEEESGTAMSEDDKKKLNARLSTVATPNTASGRLFYTVRK